jgi:hypothetical protein
VRSGRAHSAGFDDEAGVFRIFDVWETREQAERFLAEHVQPLVEQGPGCIPESGRLHSTHQRRLLRATPRGRVKRRLSRGPGPLIVLFVSA